MARKLPLYTRWVPIPDRRRRRKVTLADIALACDVAESTVSRALSNPNRVSAEMYERVTRRARELGYRSALLPAEPATEARGTVAIVFPNLTNPYNLDVLRGCYGQVAAAGYLQIVVTTNESVPLELKRINELAQVVDGVILASPRSDDEVLKRIAETVPLVTLNREVPGVSSVVVDTPSGLAQALEYLVSLGHQEIAYVRGPSASRSDESRYDALGRAAERLGVTLTEVGSFQPLLQSGAAAADVLAMTKATAAIFFNDTLAIGALGRFTELGIEVPRDISVVGCDDIFGASFANPPLTTVTATAELAGRAVTDLLLASFESKDRAVRHDRLGTLLTVRKSTGPRPEKP